VDYNQNAKDRTVASAYSVRPTPDARVSTPLAWDEVADCQPEAFTIDTVPERFARLGDPWRGMDEAAGSLEPLLSLAEQDEAAGMPDAPWPPHYDKQAGEPPRVQPSRRRMTKPVITLSRAQLKADALEGLERWKAKHPDVVPHLQPSDVLVDSMRGRAYAWWRVRVNLEHVPDELRPAEVTPDPDFDPRTAK
jgi:hypothetical protein